jgi:hypothetical protein
MPLTKRFVIKTSPTQAAPPGCKRIWTEERCFKDSQNNLGLQLADIASTTLCRAMNGNLMPPGWEPMARLLIRKKTARFLQIGTAAGGQHPPLEAHAATVWTDPARRGCVYDA